jgi:hypothetical protein
MTKSNRTMKLIITSLLFLLTNLIGNAQIIKSKLDVVGGISAREYAHIGLRYQYAEIAQLGVYVGNDLEINANEAIGTFCIDNMIHFGKLNFFSNRSVWYARQGYTYLKNRIDADETRKYSYIDLSLGREFPFSNRLGVNVDFGLIWQFREYHEKNPPLEAPINTNFRTYPLARVQLYYSF